MSDDKRRVDFRELNWLGKSVYVGAVAMRMTANLIDAAADRAIQIADDSTRAYQREVDPNIEDAKIIEERPRGGTDEETEGGGGTEGER